LSFLSYEFGKHYQQCRSLAFYSYEFIKRQLEIIMYKIKHLFSKVKKKIMPILIIAGSLCRELKYAVPVRFRWFMAKILDSLQIKFVDRGASLKADGFLGIIKAVSGKK